MNTKSPQPMPGEGRLVPRHAAYSKQPPPPQPDRNDGAVEKNPTADRHSAIGSSLQRDTDFMEVPLDKVRFIHAGGPPTEAQLAHAQGSALFVEGEMLNLVWVNQEDIRRLGVRFDMPELCPECGRLNERPTS